MKKEYDFTNAEKNPFAKRLKRQITINIDEEVVDYFKRLSTEEGIPYQTLINMYLYDCVKNKRKLKTKWE